jgi:hypothetical protein
MVKLSMTKFGKSEKIGLSSLPFRNIRFRQVQSKTEKEAKLEDSRGFEAW